MFVRMGRVPSDRGPLCAPVILALDPRTCHPSLIPEEPRDSVSQLVVGVIGLLLLAVALFYIVPVAAW
jgi:hypothetical protein